MLPLRIGKPPILEGCIAVVALLVTYTITFGAPLLPRQAIFIPYDRLLSVVWLLYCVSDFVRGLVRYRRWRTMPVWSLPVSDLEPYRATPRTLIGAGFEWTGRHCEAIARYKDTSPTFEAAALHGVGHESERPVTIPRDDSVTHLSLEGATRSGKSVLLSLLATQEIMRGDGALCVIEPKGDDRLTGTILEQAYRCGRKVAVFAPYFAGLSCKLNPLSSCQTPEEVTARIEPMFVQTGEPIFAQMPLRLVLLIARLQRAVGKRWGLGEIYNDVMIPERTTTLLGDYMRRKGIAVPPGAPVAHLKGLYGKAEKDTLIDEALHFLEMTPDRFDGLMSNIQPAFLGVVNSDYSHLLSADDDALTWEKIARERMVVLISTSSLLMGEIGNRLGRLVLADLMGFCGIRNATSTDVSEPVTLVIDEAGQIAYPHLAGQISTMGGSNARLILAWQARAGISEQMGRNRAEELFANISSQIFFRLPGEDADTASERFGVCEIKRVSTGRSGMYSDDSPRIGHTKTLSQGAPRPLIDASLLRSLPPGHAFMSRDGKAYKLRIPLIADPDWNYIDTLGYGSMVSEIRRKKSDDTTP